MLIDEMLSKNDNHEKLNQKDINELSDKWKKLISQLECEFLDLIGFSQNYIGNMKTYEGYWKDRVINKNSIRRFYDEREWRALKLNPKMTHLTFAWSDITEIIIRDEKDNGEIINVLIKKFGINKDNVQTKLFLIDEIITQQ
jgi:hypothetical protein